MTAVATPLYHTESGAWEIVIGLEVHAQVLSNAKLFSSAGTSFAADPNTQVSPIDAGMPGMLPTLNAFCVKQAVKTGLGLHAAINLFSRFDRKNYFYPDLPTGYQITQFFHPIVGEGFLDIDLENGKSKRIRVERIHLEQDAGKSIHDLGPSHSFIDLNRAGTALMEIVTHPDLRSAEEVMAFVRKLRLLLRYLGTSDGNMEEGSLRVDVNVSVRRPEADFGCRVEIKNVNSIRFIGQAIEYEAQRQIKLLEEGGEVVQETRLFDPSNGETRSMRSKEDAQDYRYHPEPDLLPIILTPDFIEDVRQELPELPDDKRHRLMAEYELSLYDASLLVSEVEIAAFYEEALSALPQKNNQNAKMLANWLMGELFALLNKEGLKIADSKVSPVHLAELVHLIATAVISGKIAKEVFAEMWQTGAAPQSIIDQKGLVQITDTSLLEEAILQVIHDNPSMVEEYLSGKDKLFGFFVGQVMKKTNGKANPQAVNELLLKHLQSAQ